MKGITTACNGKEMTEREEKSALKHPPRHHSLTSFSVRPPPRLYSSSLDLADQFPLDIDYCYNCTILITCPLETLFLSFFPPRYTHCPLLSLFISVSAGFLSKSLYSGNIIPLQFALDRK